MFHFLLDSHSGVPAYRQIIDQVQAGLAAGKLSRGDQLPTVRQVAVDLEINPNTVLRAYRELEIRGVLDTQQGTGTFIANKTTPEDETERARRLEQFVADVISRAGSGGFTLREVTDALQQQLEPRKRTK
jgi:GntR family transcriptional regulator